jgi:hypothetical protein
LKEKIMAEQRIYRVTAGSNTHLVQANSQAQALRHVAGKMFSVEIAKAVDVAQAMMAGAKLEVASFTVEQGTLEGV